MRKQRLIVTEELVKDNLPTPPAGYSYSTERVTPQVIKVWLHHPEYLFKSDVTTIYCYVKKDMIHPPFNTKKMRVQSLCHLNELSECDPYSTINDTHDVTSLLHL